MIYKNYKILLNSNRKLHYKCIIYFFNHNSIKGDDNNGKILIPIKLYKFTGNVQN